MAIHDVNNPLVLFKKFYGTFTDLIAAAGADLVPLLLTQAHENFDAHVKSRSHGMQALACRGGCASCCGLRVAATAPEMLFVKRYFTKLEKARGIAFVRDLIGKIKAANAATHGIDNLGRMEKAEVCPFIENGLCVIYPARPLACRGHASFSEQVCVDALAGEETDIPVSEPHLTGRSLVQNAMQSALRDSGHSWGSYELNQALSSLWRMKPAKSNGPMARTFSPRLLSPR